MREVDANPMTSTQGTDTTASAGCPFCRIVAGQAPAAVVHEWGDTIAIAPLNPVTPEHILVIPKQHVMDALEQPAVTAQTMLRTAELATGPCNLITSVGAAATQSVYHLHIHIVPRSHNDGLALPWRRTDGQ